jgi:hypothetical protein
LEDIIMANETKQIGHETAKQHLPEEWQERVHKAAQQFGLKIPNIQEIASQEEAEQALRQAEQEGGE